MPEPEVRAAFERVFSSLDEDRRRKAYYVAYLGWSGGVWTPLARPQQPGVTRRHMTSTLSLTEGMAETSNDTAVPELTEAQKKRIAENRERAIQIKKAKLALRSIAER